MDESSNEEEGGRAAELSMHGSRTQSNRGFRFLLDLVRWGEWEGTAREVQYRMRACDDLSTSSAYNAWGGGLWEC